jgi:hypothetical protein
VEAMTVEAMTDCATAIQEASSSIQVYQKIVRSNSVLETQQGKMLSR